MRPLCSWMHREGTLHALLLCTPARHCNPGMKTKRHKKKTLQQSRSNFTAHQGDKECRRNVSVSHVHRTPVDHRTPVCLMCVFVLRVYCGRQPTPLGVTICYVLPHAPAGVIQKEGGPHQVTTIGFVFSPNISSCRQYYSERGPPCPFLVLIVFTNMAI